MIDFVGSGGRDRTGDLRIMMPGLFISDQGLASIPLVKPAFIDQRVSLILSNPKPSIFSIFEDGQIESGPSTDLPSSSSGQPFFNGEQRRTKGSHNKVGHITSLKGSIADDKRCWIERDPAHWACPLCRSPTYAQAQAEAAEWNALFDD
jgi:hypothetical protein